MTMWILGVLMAMVGSYLLRTAVDGGSLLRGVTALVLLFIGGILVGSWYGGG